MAMEIERKFQVCNDGWRAAVTRTQHISQGYLDRNQTLSTRIRVVDKTAATLTIKSGRAGLRRLEFEYAIPPDDAEQLLKLRRGALVQKTRHIVPWHGLTWEIDVFEGDNAGLVIAEIELDHETQRFQLPPWLGVEITGQPQYYNSSLSEWPYLAWEQNGEQGAQALPPRTD
jgi:adenylate cyclase